MRDMHEIAKELRTWLSSEEGARAFGDALQRIHESVATLRADRMLDRSTIERPMTPCSR
jgi:hypothetical protein